MFWEDVFVKETMSTECYVKLENISRRKSSRPRFITKLSWAAENLVLTQGPYPGHHGYRSSMH